MRREDIELRRSARGGDARACLEMATRLFTGGGGFQRNVNLGLGYLQQELADGRTEALHLVGRAVPLEAIVAQRLQGALARAAQDGCRVAGMKLGVWMALGRDQRDHGVALLAQSGLAAGAVTRAAADDPTLFAAVLAALPPAHLNAGLVALACARDALAGADMQSACHCIRVAAALPESREPRELDEVVSRAIRLASERAEGFSLPAGLTEGSLRRRSEQGDVEAQYALGCAFAGLNYGALAPSQLVKEPSPGRAAGLLLRAADAGRHDAWLDLFHTALGARGMVSGNEVARFFLEKAARSGLVEAQTRLGVVLLAEATNVDEAEEAVVWLDSAADSHSPHAREVLATLVLPLPELPLEYERGILEKISALDRDLGMRMALARALHLTRHEALSFSPARDMRPWGLALRGSSKENPKGRLAPAVSTAMRTELGRVREFFGQSPVVEGALVLHRARSQRRVFDLLSIAEESFFAGNIGRSWSHHGFGRHWASFTGLAQAMGQETGLSRPRFLARPEWAS